MDSFYSIHGNRRLEGTVTISGAKNAAVAIIPAAVLAGEPCVLENLPNIADVESLREILEGLGAKVDMTEGGCMRIDPSTINTRDATSSKVSSMRASYYLLGAMLGAYGEIELALPGGCVIGPRPIDQHVKGMRALGAKIYMDESRNVLRAQATKLKGAEIFFDVVSVGATINVMLAATRAEGTTVLSNVAKEPHVVDVANFLNMMGASVRGAGTDVIRIQGRKKLHGCSYSIIPDQIETGTYMIAAAATRGDVVIKNVIPTHMEAISAKLMESGARVIEGDDGRDFFLRVTMDDRPRPVSFRTMVYPGFPTDLQQPMMAYLTTASGTSVITENIFENRFNHVKELRKLGASISISKRVARVKGVENLRGGDIYASDLRAGAALIVAGLMSNGETRVHNIGYIDRGYEYLDSKFKAIGADIVRIEEE
ncbi:MAG: UDP-N-acetylglucosamine 1-carboxyvinyltransferase [Clostridia bacterium]|nr:UDP-N-acetylglucosamine 1-carboxyvinyltransferase [Clostridia bacterium]MBR0436417.1 UDP-N-acetylglucosamine 1-carboxyvinyltransferase [Clostridia bacterium]